MEELIKHLLDNNLRDLKGMKVSGKIPVDPAFLNELIEEWLRAGSTPEPGASAPSSTAPASSGSGIPVDKLPNLIRRHVKKLELGVENGKMVLAFEFRVEE